MQKHTAIRQKIDIKKNKIKENNDFFFSIMKETHGNKKNCYL